MSTVQTVVDPLKIRSSQNQLLVYLVLSKNTVFFGFFLQTWFYCFVFFYKPGFTGFFLQNKITKYIRQHDNKNNWLSKNNSTIEKHPNCFSITCVLSRDVKPSYTRLMLKSTRYHPGQRNHTDESVSRTRQDQDIE